MLIQIVEFYCKYRQRSVHPFSSLLVPEFRVSRSPFPADIGRGKSYTLIARLHVACLTTYCTCAANLVEWAAN